MSAYKCLGQVKLFDADKGYGFIRSLDRSFTQDIFVHWKDIIIRNRKNRSKARCFLVTGEYVTFNCVANLSDDKRRPKAVMVTGLIDSYGRQGSLICDHGEVEFKSYYRTQFQQPTEKTLNPSGSNNNPQYSILNEDISILGLDLFDNTNLIKEAFEENVEENMTSINAPLSDLDDCCGKSPRDIEEGFKMINNSDCEEAKMESEVLNPSSTDNTDVQVNLSFRVE